MKKVSIEIINLKKIKQERNPGIKRAIECALNEIDGTTKHYPSYLGVMFVYIDGDPFYKRLINYN